MRRFVGLFLLLNLFTVYCSKFIEGDILIRKETDPFSNMDTAGGVKIADPRKLWPGGYVYYRFDRTFQNSQHQRLVENMMRYLESKVDGCIMFEKSETKVDAVLITADGGDKGSGTSCFSELGRIGGEQILNLDTSCLKNHTIVHELMHTLGFNHEHNRPDRDSFVTVVTENIWENSKKNFIKRERGNSEWFELGDVDTMNTPFDFMSVLLYPPSLSSSKSVSKNGKKTLKYNAPLIASWPEFPPDEEPLTVIDSVELALAYGCQIDQDNLIQYIHYNRLSSSQKISNMKRELNQQSAETKSSAQHILNLETQLKHLEKTMHTLSKGQMDQLRKEMKLEMTNRLKEMKSELISEIKGTVQDMPNLCICGYQNYWGSTNTITYDSLISDYSNVNDANRVHGKLDTSSGTFTAFTRGYYTVTFSGYAYMHSTGNYYRMELYLQHNNNQVKGSKWFAQAETFVAEPPNNKPKDQGSRSVILYMAEGDTLKLKANYLQGAYYSGLYDLTFCVTLSVYT